MYNLVVFASGGGTTLQAIIDAIEEKKLNCNINLVVSNVHNAYALERAKNAGIETYVIKSKQPGDIDVELENLLSNYDIDLIVLAGYLRKIGPKLVEKYIIINTHPSLIPKFCGKGMYGMKVHEAVVSAKEKISGATVHYVNNNYDEGNIISQTTIDVLPDDTAEDVSEKVKSAEKIQLIEVIKKLSE
jgi:phosphoribosylglycinamide formyltransferase-1